MEKTTVAPQFLPNKKLRARMAETRNFRISAELECARSFFGDRARAVQLIRALSRWSENGKFPFSAVRARVFFLKQKFSATVIHFPRAEKKQACQEKYPRKQPRIFHAPNFDRACTKSAYPQGCFLSAAENFLVAISNSAKTEIFHFRSILKAPRELGKCPKSARMYARD